MCYTAADLQHSGMTLENYQVLTIPDGMEYEWIKGKNGIVPWKALAQYGLTTGMHTLLRGPPYYIAQRKGVTIGCVDPLFGNGVLFRKNDESVYSSYPSESCFSVLVVKPKNVNK